MKTINRAVFVNGKRFPVQETADGLKAHLFGIKGWNSVYHHNTGEGAYTQLTKLIRHLLTQRTIYDVRPVR